MKYNRTSYRKVKSDIMCKRRKRAYDRLIYPHIRHIAGIEGFEYPKQCEVDVDEKFFIARQGNKEKTFYYENIVSMQCGVDNTYSRTFFFRDTGMHHPNFDMFPRANRISVRGVQVLDSVRIWYKEEGDEAYDIVFIDDIDGNKRKECLVMGLKIEYQFKQRKYRKDILRLRMKHGFRDKS